ncbi:MAG: hypothetical protein ABGY95_10910 [Rubritalea sp.]|uniref:hypothetical protein n=1 Tax=Rubritalea sp. TaxID=2109375 RepID=UPI003242FC87
MKGSPIIATAITIVVLLALYMSMRSIILPEEPNSATVDAHAGHDHSSHQEPTGGHNDNALETDFELYFSSIPESVTIFQPSTNKEVLKITDLDSSEWTGSGTMSLDGHFVELQVDIEWQTPSEMNFAQIITNPARHASREKTLRSDGNISDIAEFNW